jgi:hypothetical protein
MVVLLAKISDVLLGFFNYCRIIKTLKASFAILLLPFGGNVGQKKRIGNISTIFLQNPK